MQKNINPNLSLSLIVLPVSIIKFLLHRLVLGCVILSGTTRYQRDRQGR